MSWRLRFLPQIAVAFANGRRNPLLGSTGRITRYSERAHVGESANSLHSTNAPPLCAWLPSGLGARRAANVCRRKHSFDIARSGYINLLQPQERRAKQPGDTAEAISARRRLHDRGFTEHQRPAIAEAINATPDDVVLDAGCGDGFYLGTLQRETGFQAHGIDISIPAVDAAARRYRECEWVVANADRMVPYPDQSFAIVLSITARMNPGEFRRVLREGGRLLVATPSPDDLIELRGSGRDRVGQTVGRFAGRFTLINQRRVSTCADLNASDVRDVLISIYRPMQRRPVEARRVTFSLDLLLFQVT